MRTLSLEAGAFAAVVANHWAKGGAGAVDLAHAVEEACAASRSEGSPFKYVRLDTLAVASIIPSYFRSYNSICKCYERHLYTNHY